jgi:hypothetical protein
MKNNQTITVKAWDPQGDLALHLVFHFSAFRDRLARIEEKVGTWEDRPFHFGTDADSIADRFAPAAEAAGWRAEVEVEGDRLPSKREGDLLEG